MYYYTLHSTNKITLVKNKPKKHYIQFFNLVLVGHKVHLVVYIMQTHTKVEYMIYNNIVVVKASDYRYVNFGEIITRLQRFCYVVIYVTEVNHL